MSVNGVFGLTQIYINKVENSLTKTNSDWSQTLGGYGYFSQGLTTPSAASATTDILRLEESTGTITTRPTSFAVGKYERGALTSQYYAYFCCGLNPAGNLISTIEKLDYANETRSTAPEVAPPRVSQAQISTSQFGYVAGGTPGAVSTISRFTFSVETFSTPGYSLLPAAKEKVGVTRSYYAAHYVGGTPVASIYSRLDFNTEINEIRSATFPQIVSGTQGISNKFFGYYAGGNAPPLAPIYQSGITRLDFATESFTTTPQVLSAGKNDLASFSLSKFGYFGGGYFTPVALHYSTIERFDFTTEVDSTLPNRFPVGKSRLTGIEGGYHKSTHNINFPTTDFFGNRYINYRNNSGYFAGGGPEYVSTITKLDFYSETRTDASVLPSGINSADVVYNNYNAYIAGGLAADSPAYVLRSNIIRYEYVGDTLSVIPTKLPSARFESSGISGLGYGYFAGGIISPVPSRPFDARSFLSSIVRFDFTTEGTRSYNVKLPEVAAYQTSTYSETYGYFAGGITQTSFASTSLTRIEFSSDILVIRIPGTLPVGRKNMSSVNTGIFAYFAGGENSSNTLVTTITKLDFSTETISNSSATLTSAQSQMGSVSTIEYGAGYFFGGTPLNFNLNKLTFATETFSSADPPGPLSPEPFRNNMTSFESVA